MFIAAPTFTFHHYLDDIVNVSLLNDFRGLHLSIKKV